MSVPNMQAKSRKVLRRILPHLPLPISADKAAPIPLTPLTPLPSSHESSPTRSLGMRFLRPRSCASHTEHDRDQEKEYDGSPHEAEIVSAQTCGAAVGAEIVATDDICCAVGR